MKFILASLVTLAMGATLGAGILLAVGGNWWVITASVIAYLLAFARLGCLPRSTH
jgi:hypothetical protein